MSEQKQQENQGKLSFFLPKSIEQMLGYIKTIRSTAFSNSPFSLVSETKSGLGSNMQEIYGKLGPWGYETPAVSPSKYHAVLYELPITPNCLPKPHTNTVGHHWDDDHVRMPYSEKNLFPKITVRTSNHETVFLST